MDSHINVKNIDYTTKSSCAKVSIGFINVLLSIYVKHIHSLL